MSVTGIDGGEPVRVGVSIVDQGAGMWAAMGILAALNRRHVTGEGCHVIDLAVRDRDRLDGAAHRRLSVGRRDAPSARLGRDRDRAAPGVSDRATATSWWRPATTICSARCAARSSARSSCAMRASPPTRSASRTAARSCRCWRRFSARRPSAEWLARLDAAGVPAAPIENVAQVVASPQTAALGMLQKGPHLDMTLTGLPLEFDGARPPYRARRPGSASTMTSCPDPTREESRLMKDLKYQTLALEQPAEHLLIVRFNRPEVRNAISTQVGARHARRVLAPCGADRLSLRGADRRGRQGVLRRRRPEGAQRHDRRAVARAARASSSA